MPLLRTLVTTTEVMRSVPDRAMNKSRATDFFFRRLCLRTRGLRSTEIMEMRTIVVTTQMSGEVTPPSLNIAMVREREREETRS